MSDKPIIGYMCQTDWDHELGRNHHGNKIFPSKGAIVNKMPCVKECGIVQVEVRLKRIVNYGNYGKPKL